MSTINVPDDERTIQGAMNRSHDGDTVVVHGESEAEPTLYPEPVEWAKPITSLTVRAEPRRGVKMYGFSTYGGEGLTLEGFHTVPAYDDVVSVNSIRSPNVTIRDFYIHNAPWAAIYVDPSNPELPGGIIEDCHIYGCGTGIHTTGVGWRVLNNNIERLINRLGKDADYMRAWGEHLLVKGNHFHGTVQGEIGGAHVDGFQAFDKGDRYMRGLRIEDNIIEDCHQAVILADLGDPGDVHNVLIYNNWIRNVWGMGIYVRNVVKDVRIQHNLIQDCMLKGVFARWGAEVDVTANIFMNAGSNYHGDTDSVITGGYNILNREGYPRFSVSTDFINVNPLLDVDGYAKCGLTSPSGAPIGRIRPAAPEPEPEPEEPEEGHDHDLRYATSNHIHMHDADVEHEHDGTYADRVHAHGYAGIAHGHEGKADAYHDHDGAYAEFGHMHDGHSLVGHGHPQLANIIHAHPMSNETRLMFEVLAEAGGAQAQQIRDRLGE